MHPVTLHGRVVILREFRADDAAAALSVVGDDEVTRWLSFDSRDLAGSKQMLDGALKRATLTPRIEYYLAVTLPGDELIGVRAAGSRRRPGREARVRDSRRPVGQRVRQRRSRDPDGVR